MVDVNNSAALGVALRCAEAVNYHFSDYTTIDDLYQSAWEFLLRHPVAWQEFEEAEDRKMAERTLERVIRDHLTSIARREKAETRGYHVDDECYFTPRVVAELLPLTLDIEAALLPSATTDDAPGRGSNPHGQGDFVASLLDVRRAWTGTAFRGSEMDYIRARYVDDMDWGHIAATYGAGIEEVQRRTAIGLRRMSDYLGGLPSRQCKNDCECKEVP